MKIKLPFTEEFLWGIYAMVEATDEMYAVLSPRTFREVICPDLFRMKKYYQGKRQRRSFSKFVYYLKKKGYLRERKLPNKKAFAITSKGMKKISHIAKRIRRLPERKDNKLQMIMYDIPELRKDDREDFREALKLLGYTKLQKSVWVSRYDVFGETQELIREYRVGGCVRLFLVEERAL